MKKHRDGFGRFFWKGTNEMRNSQMSETGFRTIEPKILYFGTPVALISLLNEDGGTNLAPISSNFPTN